MFLNERKIKILEAIVNDYIISAEPIGSRTIAKKYDLGISSATIRNEMSDLEELGLIVQPHASSGRVPSDKGYRYYVDSLMQKHELTGEQIDYVRNLIAGNLNKVDYLMQELAKAISILTNCTAIITEPDLSLSVIKHLQLVPINENSILLVTVSVANNVKNTILQVSQEMDSGILTEITYKLNKYFSGVSYDEITDEMLSEFKKDLGEYEIISEDIINAIKTILTHADDTQVYTSGIKNILEFPEFSDIHKARAIFDSLEEREQIISLLDNHNSGNITILIGSENEQSHFKNCSIIKTKYSIGGQSFGSIGIIGPTRMDYSQVISVLNGVIGSINLALTNNDKNEKDLEKAGKTDE